MKQKEITLTQSLAAEFLRTDEQARTARQGRHRNVSGVKVAEWISSIKAGKWKLTHQGIVISDKGEIVDGRHRIHAVYHAGLPIQINMTIVPEDEVEDYIAALDCGRARDTATQLWISDGVKQSTKIKPAINAQIVIATLRWKRDSTMSIQGMVECYKEQRDFFNKALPICGNTRFRNGAILGSIAWYAQAHPEKALEFLESSISGAGLAADSPVLWFIKANDKYSTKFRDMEMMVRITANALESYHIGKPMLALPTMAEHGIIWLNKVNPKFKDFFLSHVAHRIMKAEQKLAHEMWV